MTWKNAQTKFDHPLADSSHDFPSGTHESNVTYRLTVPMLAHALRLGQTGLLILFAVSGVVLLYFTLSVAYKVSGSKRTATLVCLGVACVWPGEAAFHELRGGYYDALALCLIVLAFATPSPILTGSLLFVAAWTDERALFGGVFLLLFLELSSIMRSERWWSGKFGAVLVAMVGYVLLRVALTVLRSYHFGSTGGVGFSVLAQQTNAIPLAIWSGLSGSWILVLCCLAMLLSRKRYIAAASFGIVLATAIVASLMVIDVTRGMAYCLPAVFVALAVLKTIASTRSIERFAALSSIASLLVPTLYLEGNSGLWWLKSLPEQIIHWLHES